jgi:WD40 repeat protein
MTNHHRRATSSGRNPRTTRPVLRLERLEDRAVPAVITVTTTADTADTISPDGFASLREAITSINNQSDFNTDVTANRVGGYASLQGGTADVIDFNILGAGVQTIAVGSAEPTIVVPLTIDGYSQLLSSGNTLANGDNAVLMIQLSGATGGTFDGLTLGTGSGGSVIKGLVINNFGGNGIVIQSNGNTIVGNFVGVDPTGTRQQPNGSYPNSGDGIRVVNASENNIGSPAPVDRNIVSGNALNGVHIIGTLAAGATGNTVAGNFVGVAADGKSSVGNRTETMPAMNTPGGNNLFGIEISGGNNNTIGGTTAGAGNVVGFNAAGIELDDGSQNNIVQGNFVGVGADSTTPAGNLLHGIALRSSNGFVPPLGPAQPNEPGTSNNVIGGTQAGAGNLVEFNGTGGIAVFGNPVSGSNQPNVNNAIEGNSVFENGRSSQTGPTTPLLGIDLTNAFTFPRDDGATANDSKGHGAANDPNNFQNFPVLTSVTVNGGQTTIAGTLTAAVNTTFRIEFFANNPDPLGLPAEGQQFLGFANVMTNTNGVATFTPTLNVAVANGSIVTATATDPNGNTSEFSAGLPFPLPTPTPTPTPTPAPVVVVPPPFVSVAFGPLGEVVEVVNADGTLRQFDASGVHVLGSGVRSASVAFGPTGEVLLVTFQNGTLTQFDATGSHTLGSGVLSASVAFGPFGEVLEVVATDGTLRQFDPLGVHVLGSGVRSAGVAFGPQGQVLLVIFQDGTLRRFDATGVHTLASGVLSAGAAFSPTIGLVQLIAFQDGSVFQFDAFGPRFLAKLF